MEYLNIPSYVNFADTNCDLFNSSTFRCCLFVTTIISFLIISWFLNRRFTERKNNLTGNRIAYIALHKATFDNDVIKCYKIIQGHPEAINVPYEDGYTPFMRACLNGNTQLVRLMLNFGADLTLLSGIGESPFYLAVFYHIKNPRVKDASCIHTLYYAGSDVNVTNLKGYAPIHLVAMFGHVQLTHWLLNKGAKVDIHPDPFMIARSQGHYQTARILQSKKFQAIE